MLVIPAPLWWDSRWSPKDPWKFEARALGICSGKQRGRRGLIHEVVHTHCDMCMSVIHTHMHIHRHKHFLSSQILQNCLRIKWSWESCVLFSVPGLGLSPPYYWTLWPGSMAPCGHHHTQQHVPVWPVWSFLFPFQWPVTFVSFSQMQGRPHSYSNHMLPGCIAHCHWLVTSPTGYCVLTLLEAGSLGYLCHHNKCLRQQIHKVSRFLLAQLQKFWSDSLTLLLSAWGGAAPVGAVYGGANLLT